MKRLHYWSSSSHCSCSSNRWGCYFKFYLNVILQNFPTLVLKTDLRRDWDCPSYKASVTVSRWTGVSFCTSSSETRDHRTKCWIRNSRQRNVFCQVSGASRHVPSCFSPDTDLMSSFLKLLFVWAALLLLFFIVVKRQRYVLFIHPRLC